MSLKLGKMFIKYLRNIYCFQKERLLVRRSGSQTLQISCGQQQRGRLAESSYNSSCESEDGEVLSSPGTGPLLTEGTTSAGEWIGITTNSEECSYSSEIEESDSQHECNVRDNIELNDHPFAWEFELVILHYYRITQALQLYSELSTRSAVINREATIYV